MPRPYSNDLRWRAIWMVELLGYSVDVVAATLFMSPRTIERYISKCLNTGDVNSEKLGRPFNSFAMHPHVEFVIMEAILEQPDTTLAEIAYNVFEQTGSENAVSSILRYLKRNSFTRKKLSKIALQRSEEARILLRSNVCLLDPEMFVFLDESGFDKRLSRSYGYSPVGTRATVKRQAQNWGPRITAIPIICMEGMVEVGVYQGNVDGARFEEFVDQKLCPNLLPFNGVNPRSVVIMDNAAVHHTLAVVDRIHATGAMVVFLPPYSPDFMPCEELFAQTKNWIRENDVAWQFCMDPQSMVEEAFLQVTDEQIRNYIRHAEYL